MPKASLLQKGAFQDQRISRLQRSIKPQIAAPGPLAGLLHFAPLALKTTNLRITLFDESGIAAGQPL